MRFKVLNSLPIIITVCFLLVLILGIGLLLPKYQDLKGIQRTIEEKKAEIQYKEKYFAEIGEIKTELEKYETELSKIDSALPQSPSLPSLFNFLQEASSQSGLVLKGISPFTVAPVGENSDIKETEFNLQLSGGYSSFKNFLSTLEKSARMIEIENISFSLPIEEELFTFNIRVKIFSY